MSATPQSVSPVYLSGPMFSVADQTQQQAIADLLKNSGGMDSYLPQRDGIEVAKLMAHVNDPEGPGVDPMQILMVIQFMREIVYSMDMFQLLSRCNSLVFNMDGRVPDDGSVSETAAAWASGQPIVVYKTTPITMLGGFDNPMVDGLSTSWGLVNDVTKLPAAILAAADAMQGQQPARFTPSWQVKAVTALGQTVWEAMPDIDKILNPPGPPDPKVMIGQLLALAKEWSSQLQTAFPGGPQVWPPGP